MTTHLLSMRKYYASLTFVRDFLRFCVIIFFYRASDFHFYPPISLFVFEEPHLAILITLLLT